MILKSVLYFYTYNLYFYFHFHFSSLNPTLARDGRFYSSLSSYQIKEKAHYYLSLEPRDITDPNASFILVSNKIIRSHTTY